MKKKFLAGMILAAGIFTGCGSDPPPPPPPSKTPQAETAETKQTVSIEEQLAKKSAAELKDKQELKRYILTIQPYLDNIEAKWQTGQTADFNELSKSERQALVWSNMKVMEHNANLYGAMIQQIGKIDTPKSAEELKKTLYALNDFYFKSLREYMNYFSGSEEERHSLSGVASSLMKIASMSSSSELDRLIRKRDQIIESVRDVEVDTSDIPKPEKIADSVFENSTPEPEPSPKTFESPAVPEEPEPARKTREELDLETSAAMPLQRFHQYITERKFQQAFEFFSKERQSKINFDDWVAGFENTVSSEADYIQMTSYDDNHVVLYYVLFAKDKPNIERRFEGEATMILEDGKWKIDSAHNTLLDNQ